MWKGFPKSKTLLSSLILTWTKEGIIVYLYLPVTKHALSPILVQEVEGKEKPI